MREEAVRAGFQELVPCTRVECEGHEKAMACFASLISYI
jgi:hypothetical protein